MKRAFLASLALAVGGIVCLVVVWQPWWNHGLETGYYGGLNQAIHFVEDDLQQNVEGVWVSDGILYPDCFDVQFSIQGVRFSIQGEGPLPFRGCARRGCRLWITRKQIAVCEIAYLEGQGRHGFVDCGSVEDFLVTLPAMLGTILSASKEELARMFPQETDGYCLIPVSAFLDH